MAEPRIRGATVADGPAIANIVDDAYRHYITRMGTPPGPMLDDHAARVLEGVVWVLEEGSVIVGIIVLLPATDYLLLENIAVSPARQGVGFGPAVARIRGGRGIAPRLSGNTTLYG